MLPLIFLLLTSTVHYTAPTIHAQDLSTSTIATYIKQEAIQYGVDSNMALYVANAESGFNPNAQGDYATSTGYTSFGIWQIHEPKEKGLTIQDTKNIFISTEWAMKEMVKDKGCRIWSTCPIHSG